MLYQGQEFGEDFTLRGLGLGRTALLRPINWDYFYDGPGRNLTNLTRRLMALRGRQAELRDGDHWLYDDPTELQNNGVLAFRRANRSSTTVVLVNFTDQTRRVGFAFPHTGVWTDALGDGAALAVDAGAVDIDVPSNYGCVWTSAS